MPTLDGIVIMLESQFDADVIPEAVVPVQSDTDASQNQRSIDVYVPSYLASQFWISYTVKPGALVADEAQTQTKYAFFKLMLDGECIVSWGVGEADEWKGKTMWAFFRGEDKGIGWRTVEKRGFFFRPSDDDQDFDILVYRARGRRRTSRQFQDEPSPGEKGFDLVNWGRLKEHHPQRFYQYALIDALDRPYATFRYHVRGGRHVRSHPVERQTSSSESNESYFSTTEEPSELVQELPDASQLRRLSYPPTIRLTPTSSSREPSSPLKLDAETSATTEEHEDESDKEEAVKVEEEENKEEDVNFEDVQDKGGQEEDASSVDTVVRRRYTIRTPTPLMIEGRETTNTPPSSLRRRGGAKLKGLFESAFKRRPSRAASSRLRPLSPERSSTSQS